jgi:hypothetical protein
VELIGFVLSDCVVEVEASAAKYLRAVHRTALELAVQNQFGAEIGGFWLMAEQVAQLKRLPEYYPANESPLVARAVDAYLLAQLPDNPQVRKGKVAKTFSVEERFSDNPGSRSAKEDSD